MSDPSISKWKHQGRAFLWKYSERRKNYPGWQFTCDNESCSSMLALFDILDKAVYSGTCEIKMSVPTGKVLSVPGNLKGDTDRVCAEKLFLKYRSREPDAWNLEESGNDITLTLGKNMVSALRQGINDILQGQGDYAIGTSDPEHCIRIWWMTD